MAEPKVYYGAPRVGTDMVREANLWTVDTPDALVFVLIRALDAVRRIVAGGRVSVLGYFVE